VRGEYGRDGASFIRRVCAEPDALERLTGLDVLQAQADGVELWAYGDSESVGSTSTTDM
jgi:hypothetical protein